MNDDFPILASVSASPTHPYQVLDHLAAAGVRATRSTLYRRVDALIEEGLLRAEDGRGPSGHMRRALSLTGAGKKRLATAVTTVLREEAFDSPRFSLALARAGVCEGEAIEGILRQRMSGAARRLTEEERSLRTEPGSPESWARTTRVRQVAHLQADIAWLQSVLGRRIVPQTSQPRRAAG
ncbi:MAG: hypothetical protein C0506_01120 [Anaerolinea sp.]|nr:hypothetical protein [Anaerolinea sp.]